MSKGFNQYKDATGELPNEQLRAAKWYLLHRDKLRGIVVASLGVFIFITWGFSLIIWGKYLLFGMQQDQRMLEKQSRELANYAAIQPSYTAVRLQISSPQIFTSTPNKFDIITKVRNPNARWIAYVTYKFTYRGGQTSAQTTAILPQNERPIMAYGIDSDSYLGDAKLEVINVAWRRVNSHVVSDVSKYIGERTDFLVKNFSFIVSSLGQGGSVNKIAFDLNNNSAYSYWEADFSVELISNGQIVGYFPLSLQRFMSEETRPVEFFSLSPNISVTDVKIYPLVNIFDTSLYIAPGQ